MKSATLPKAVDQVIGENIRLHRSRNRFSLAELAGAMGLDVQQVDRYESGVQSIPADQLLHLADILAVHFRVFFDLPAGSDDIVRASADQNMHN